MVLEVPAYVCERCGFYLLGDENQIKVEQHERISATGKKESLNGLIARSGINLLVFRQLPELDKQHHFLYTWDLHSEKSIIRRSTSECLNIASSFTAENIDRDVLGNVIQLNQRDFESVARRLRKEYGELYKGVKFKRLVRQSGRYHSPD